VVEKTMNASLTLEAAGYVARRDLTKGLKMQSQKYMPVYGYFGGLFLLR
jgi:hypothetical protein